MVVGSFVDIRTKNKELRKRAQVQRGKFRPKKKILPLTTKPKKRVVPTVVEPCYDSDKSEYYRPSNIIAKIRKEQEDAEKQRKKRNEDTEKLPFYPSCWESLGIIFSATKDAVQKMSLSEQAYNIVHAAMVDRGEINSDNDPEEDDWVDPLSEVPDLCELCGKPHVNADEKTCKHVLMQCFAELKSGTVGCRKWFHIGCLTLRTVPEGDWVCQQCSNDLELGGLVVGPRGLEFNVQDVDDGFDGAKAKQAAMKDRQPNKDDDEAEDIADNDSSDESKTDNTKSGSKGNTKVNDAKDGSTGDEDNSEGKDKSEEEDKSADESYATDNSDSKDEDYEADTEDEEGASSGGKKKRTGAKKRAAEVKQEAPVAAAKKKKTSHSGAKVRLTGEKPNTPKQLFDSLTRKKLKACRSSMEVLQHMSLPIKRSDKYESPDDSDDEDPSVGDQQGWPWMIHGLSCYTQVKPNDDGGKNKKTFLSKPEYHMWAGSDKAATHLREAFSPVKDFKIVVHTSFDDYFGALHSESAKSKTPPPQPKRDPNAPKKKKSYSKRWRKEK